MNQAFSKLEEGYEMAMKEYNKKQIGQLKALIDLLLDSKLPHGDREKIMTICTIDVHARDIVGKLIASKVTAKSNHIQNTNIIFLSFLVNTKLVDQV